MIKGFKRAKKIVEEAEATHAKYQNEETSTKLRLIRTHMAAQAGELSNLNTHLGMVRALVSENRDRLERIAAQLEQLRPACEHAPDGGNHPKVPS